ncbi:hypothetical protein NPIL_10351, partial [Nephila pilipes]
ILVQKDHAKIEVSAELMGKGSSASVLQHILEYYAKHKIIHAYRILAEMEEFVIRMEVVSLAPAYHLTLE